MPIDKLATLTASFVARNRLIVSAATVSPESPTFHCVARFDQRRQLLHPGTDRLVASRTRLVTAGDRAFDVAGFAFSSYFRSFTSCFRSRPEDVCVQSVVPDIV